MTRTLTATKYYFNDDTNTFTGKEYTVEFNPEVGVEKIVSVYAVEKHTTNRIDITMSEVIGNSLDATIDGLFDWDEKYADVDAMYEIASRHAKSYRI